MHLLKKSWLLATHNQGKCKEMAEILSPYGIQLTHDSSLPAPEETGLTFHENALIKAQAYGAVTSLPVLADDSGLSIAALHGEPGVFSARWTGPNQDYNVAFERIQKELGSVSSPQATFTCVLCLLFPGAEPRFYEGHLAGTLSFPPRGTEGFGYDPIFIPHGETRTCAEMSRAEKNLISHRGRAFQALLADLDTFFT